MIVIGSDEDHNGDDLEVEVGIIVVTPPKREKDDKFTCWV